jgi:hypothetical protein
MSWQGSTEGKMALTKAVLTRSGRTSKPAARWIEAMVAMVARIPGDTGHSASQVEGELLCQKSMFPDAKAGNEAFYAFKTTADPDTMYLHQAMKEPDREQFKEAMIKEVKDQVDNKNFTVVRWDSVLVDKPVMLQMKQKRDIIT